MDTVYNIKYWPENIEIVTGGGPSLNYNSQLPKNMFYYIILEQCIRILFCHSVFLTVCCVYFFLIASEEESVSLII